MSSECVRCRKPALQTVHPQMADLLKKRLEGNVCSFKSTGVGYFGPFEVTVLHRPVKHWCCLFALLVTRTVHAEVDKKLKTDACMMTITRYMARLSKPYTIISDNGTKFVGAARECFNEYNQEAIC